MTLSRRTFFGAARPLRGHPLRPPWALPESEFQAQCTRCGECVAVCPTQLLSKGSGGFPVADFTPGKAPEGCTFCRACLHACLPQALRESAGQPAWAYIAAIGDGCLAARNVVCRSCGEHCTHSAIRFRPRVGGVALAQLDLALCNGCGACLAACPTAAIHINVIESQGGA